MSGSTRVGAGGHAQGTTKGLEDGFNDVMVVDAAQVVDMNGGLRVVGEALEEFVEGFGIDIGDFVAAESGMEKETGAAGKVDDDARKRFIKRHIGMPVTLDAAFVAECFAHGLTEHDAGVFNRVVAINVEIALAFDVEVYQAVACDLLQHVVEKAEAASELGIALAVEIELDADAGFVSVAVDAGGSGHSVNTAVSELWII